MTFFTNIETWYWLAGLIIFFSAYTLSSFYIISKKKKTDNPHQLLSLYMLLKMVKIVLFAIFLAVYIFTVHVDTKRFVLAAGLLYILFLIINTLYITSVEKSLKKKDGKK
ncbi:MAG: hypothetical protein LBG77_00790 [Dysgonamonadaceae bacterium]|jgi:predicted neutral ceramidase superfamily lipid hydrolase|nr:hypothetical protein [Dysgonamonadaceae bacterium]